MSEKAISVLLVEDNPGDAILFRSILHESGGEFQEEHVERLSVAMERLGRGGIDVVLLDLSLPDSQGPDTFLKVRDAFPDLPLIVLTGFNDVNLGVRAIRDGVQDFLNKGPLDPSLLSRCIRYAIERKRSEVLLRQSKLALSASAKMAVIGQLAGGIAHDFNNMLTVIFGHSEMLLGTPGLSEKARKQVDEIHEAGERAANLTKQLLTFNRNQPVVQVVVDLNKVVSSLDGMLRRLIGEDIVLSIHLDESISRINIDINQLEQVVLNLCINARDAMAEGGEIEISTKMATGETGKQVVLSVRDTGHGMSDEVKKHIFEPFFTTKDLGKGTGLGLALISEIVKKAKGYVKLESAVSKGAVFEVYFPATDEPVSEQNRQAISSNLRGKEKILVVEDEEQIREMLRKILGDYGYEVAAVSDGDEGVKAILDPTARAFDLIISDVRMPNRSGINMVSTLRSKLPDLKVIYMSGYSANAFGEEGFHEDKTTQFIQKPFSPMAMLDRVRRYFDHPQ